MNVETARVEILGWIRMFAATFERKHSRNRKTGCDALDSTSLAALASINHLYVSGERGASLMPAGEKTGTKPRGCNPKPNAKKDAHVTGLTVGNGQRHGIQISPGQ